MAKLDLFDGKVASDGIDMIAFLLGKRDFLDTLNKAGLKPNFPCLELAEETMVTFECQSAADLAYFFALRNSIKGVDCFSLVDEDYSHPYLDPLKDEEDIWIHPNSETMESNVEAYADRGKKVISILLDKEERGEDEFPSDTKVVYLAHPYENGFNRVAFFPENRVERSLLDELFASGDYAGPFYYEPSSTINHPLKAVASCAKKVDRTSVFHLSKKTKEDVFGRISIVPDAIFDWELNEIDGESKKKVPTNAIYIAGFKNDEEAYAYIVSLGKMKQKPKVVHLVIDDESVLQFYADSLSKKLGFPIRIHSLFAPMLRSFDEVFAKERVSAGVERTFDNRPYTVLPHAEEEDNVLADICFKNRGWRNFYCSYSLFAYLDFCKDLEEKNIFGEDNNPLLRAIKEGELVPQDWFDAEYSKAIEKTDSLVYRFACHEHALWARRAILFQDDDLLRKRLQYFRPLSQFKEALGEEEGLKGILLDLCVSTYFLLDRFTKKRQFNPKKDLSNWPIDLEKLVNETDISGAMLEEIIASRNPSELIVPKPREFDLTKTKILETLEPTNQEQKGFIELVFDAPSPDAYPRPGDFLSRGDKPRYLVMRSFSVRDFASVNRHLYSRFRPMAVNGELHGPSLVLLVASPSSPDSRHPGDSRWNPNLLYSAAYPSASASAVLFRKKVSDALSIGEKGKKAIQNPINNPISFSEIPFLRYFDTLSLFSKKAVFANSIDDYSLAGEVVNHYVDRAAKCISLPFSLPPFAGYCPEMGPIATSGMAPAIRARYFVAKDEDDDEVATDAYPASVYALPFPVLHRSSLPYLSLLLFISEEAAEDLAEGRLFFDKKSLEQGKIEWHENKENGMPFRDALPYVFAILKKPDGEWASRAYREFERYPFGEKKDRALLYRLVKLGEFSEKAFFHTYIPINGTDARGLSSPGNVLDVYSICLLQVASASIKLAGGPKLLDGDSPDTVRSTIVYFANRCFDILLWRHIADGSGFPTPTLPPSRYLVDCLMGASKESRFNLSDMVLNPLPHGPIPSITEDFSKFYASLKMVSLALQFLKRGDIDRSFEVDVAGEYHEAGRIFEEHVFLRDRTRSVVRPWRLSEKCRLLDKEENEIPKRITFALPVREEAEFDVLAAVELNERYYLVVSPTKNLGYMDQRSVVVLIKNLIEGGYYLETDENAIDAIIDFLG